ncbi:hypothetical protein D3C86_1416640 [compost metagenome]
MDVAERQVVDAGFLEGLELVVGDAPRVVVQVAVQARVEHQEGVGVAGQGRDGVRQRLDHRGGGGPVPLGAHDPHALEIQVAAVVLVVAPGVQHDAAVLLVLGLEQPEPAPVRQVAQPGDLARMTRAVVVALDGEDGDPRLLELLEDDGRLGQDPRLDVALVEEVARDHHEVHALLHPVADDDVVQRAEEVLAALLVVVRGGAKVDVGDVQELERAAQASTSWALRGMASQSQITPRALAPM